MEEYFKKPTLKKGKIYSVEPYPRGKIKKAEYLGLSKSKREHVFKTGRNSDEFLIAEEALIMEVDGVVTYKPISYVSMINLTKDRMHKVAEKEKSRLTKILADVGAQL
jgi:hypothetical protein